jgi:PKD repeat protein
LGRIYEMEQSRKSCKPTHTHTLFRSLGLVTLSLALLSSCSSSNSSAPNIEGDGQASSQVVTTPPPMTFAIQTPIGGYVTATVSTNPPTSKCTLNWGDATPLTAVDTPTSAKNYNHVYTSNGIKIVKFLCSFNSSLSFVISKSITITLPTTPPPPPPEAQIARDPVGEINTSIGFDGTGSVGEDLSYAWNFGDGSTSSNDYVTHKYTQPGKYTTTLTITDKLNRTSSQSRDVTILPEIGNINANLNLTGTDTTHFELPPLPTGFNYLIDLGDGTTSNLNSFDHSYPTLGTYEIDLKVVDNRPLGSTLSVPTNSQHISSQSVPGTVIQHDRTWLTRWEPQPTAKFSNSSALGAGVTVGAAPLKVDFDASTSRGTAPLTYTWDYGDGTSGSGKIVNHIFAEGESVVTLTVIDGKGQSNQYHSYISTRNPDHRFSIRIDYPNGSVSTAALPNIKDFSSQSVGKNAFAFQDEIGQGFDQAQGTGPLIYPQGYNPKDPKRSKKPLIQSQSLETYVDHFPYVLYKGASISSIQTKWSDTNTRLVFCRLDYNPPDIVAYFNGNPISNLIPYTPPGGDTDFCSTISAFRAFNPEFRNLQPRQDAEINVTASLWNTALDFDVIGGLRTPKVTIAILPDKMIPGNIASPFTTENTITNPSGEKELLLTVQARASEVKAGVLEFKVPIYAVNDAGNLMSAANGYFRSKFDNLNSDCGDCVMVNGKAYVTVRLFVADYGMAGNYINTDTLTLMGGESASCGFDTSPWSAGSKRYLNNCMSVFPSHLAPNGVATLQPLKYPMPAYTYSFLGHVIAGKSPAEILVIEENMKKQAWEDVKTFVVDNMVPFYSSGKAFVEAVGACATQHQCNPAGIFLAGVGVIADFLPATKLLIGPVLKANRLSSIGENVLSKTLGDVVKEGSVAGKTGEEVAASVNSIFGRTAAAMEHCGNKCVANTENAIKRMVVKGKTEKEAVQKIEDAVKRDEAAGINPEDRFDHYETSITCDINSFSPDTLVWTSLGQKPISSLFGEDKTGNIAAGEVTRVWSYNEETGQNELNPVTHVFIHQDPRITTVTLQSTNGQLETLTTTPEHPFYTTTTAKHWTNAGQLKAGDKVQKKDGSFGLVKFVNTVENTRVMYNLEVARAHTFFVGTGGWLVHNAAIQWDCPNNKFKVNENNEIEVKIGKTGSAARLADIAARILKDLVVVRDANGVGLSKHITLAVSRELSIIPNTPGILVIAVNGENMIHWAGEITKLCATTQKCRVVPFPVGITEDAMRTNAYYHAEQQIYREALAPNLSDAARLQMKQIGISNPSGPCNWTNGCGNYLKDIKDNDLDVWIYYNQ